MKQKYTKEARKGRHDDKILLGTQHVPGARGIIWHVLLHLILTILLGTSQTSSTTLIPAELRFRVRNRFYSFQ